YQSYEHYDVVKISDDGDGFDNKIIESFNNGNIDYISTKNGFGIGMLLIYEIVNYLNGRVFLSNSNKGSQVTLILPKTI
ncbi:ATP-binding protein, partial [Photobacterium kishitanii]